MSQCALDSSCFALRHKNECPPCSFAHRGKPLTARSMSCPPVLCRCMPQVQELFLHAAAVVPEVVATQAAVATRGLAAATAAAAEWLDDDLDVGGRAPTVAR